MTQPRNQTQSPPMPVGPRGGPRIPGEVQRARNVRGTLLRLWSYLGRQRWGLTLTCLAVVASTLLDLLGTWLLGRAIDAYILRKDVPGLARLSALLLGVYVGSSVLTWAQAFVMAGVAQRTVRDIRQDLFERMQVLPLRFFDQRAHGELMSRLTNDVENINLVLTESLTQVISSTLTGVGVVIVMLAINPVLGVVTLAIMTALSLGINRGIASRVREGFRRQQATLGRLNGIIQETISGQKVVKAYHREADKIAEFSVANTEYRHAATRAQIFAGFMGPMMNFVGNTSLAVIAGFGGWLALRGAATPGTIASFLNYARQFQRPLNNLANLYNQIQAAIAGAERVFEVIDEEPEVDSPSAAPLGRIRGEVVFEDVCFSYDGKTPVLKHINLRAAPGQTIALVGPTGAGKTTIVNLLARFYEVDSGRITLDGRDIRDIRKDDLRRQLGVVLQDTYLFAGTVMDNIRYGRLDATDEEVIAAAKIAEADQFIHRLPDGYHTMLTERGSNLSHGQRQLLAIARAVLADPSILILDEATSSVDTRTERHIQRAMLRLMEGRTSFVIAHRLSTIRDADQILVVNHGEIVERGTHEELMAMEGFYYKLYSRQFTLGIPAGAQEEESLAS